MLRQALGANALHNDIGLFWQEIGGQGKGRYFHFGQALRFITDLAMKMYVGIAWIIALTVIAAHGVFHCAGAVVDAMNYLMFFECLECSEQRDAVCGFQAILEIFQTNCMVIPLKEVQHQKAHCGRFNLPTLELKFQLIIHFSADIYTKIRKKTAACRREQNIGLRNPALVPLYSPDAHQGRTHGKVIALSKNRAGNERNKASDVQNLPVLIKLQPPCPDFFPIGRIAILRPGIDGAVDGNISFDRDYRVGH